VAAPVPETARGPAVDMQKGYLVEEIRDGLYWATEGAYQVMFLVTGQGVIVCDAPASIGGNILNAIAEATSEPVTHVILGHSHSDHIGAASIFPGEVTYIGHELTAATLRRHQDPHRPVPAVTFADTYTLEVGSQTLVLDYKGVNHEPGNIFVYAPRQRVLFFVDVIFPGWVPFKNCAMTEDVPGFLKAHEQVLGYDFDTLVAGHLTRLGSREDVEVQRDYVRDVRAACEAALRSVNWMEVAGEVGWDNLWVVFDAYLDRVAETAAAEVTPRWLGRLAGADVFTQDHCWTMMESLRIDGGMVPGMSGTAEAGPQWAADR
jgi:glyoxylase-like metal-dependent hydrolase (beta-lactamase superfamily II)